MPQCEISWSWAWPHAGFWLIVPWIRTLGPAFILAFAGYCWFYPIRRATLRAPGKTFPSSLGGLAGGVREWPARRRLNAPECAKLLISSGRVLLVPGPSINGRNGMIDLYACQEDSP